MYGVCVARMLSVLFTGNYAGLKCSAAKATRSLGSSGGFDRIGRLNSIKRGRQESFV